MPTPAADESEPGMTADEVAQSFKAIREGLEELARTVAYAMAVGRLANRYRALPAGPLEELRAEFERMPPKLQDDLVLFCRGFPGLVDR